MELRLASRGEERLPTRADASSARDLTPPLEMGRTFGRGSEVTANHHHRRVRNGTFSTRMITSTQQACSFWGARCCVDPCPGSSRPPSARPPPPFSGGAPAVPFRSTPPFFLFLFLSPSPRWGPEMAHLRFIARALHPSSLSPSRAMPAGSASNDGHPPSPSGLRS